MQKQKDSNKLSEINYRKIVLKQHLGENENIQNEFNSKEYKQLLGQKLKETKTLFKSLQKQGHPLSPYLEIGSEHSLRPALLNQNFKAKGFATDISLFSLANSPKYVKHFKLKKAPKRICADANNLPFKSNSFPFVFVYESLHHFPHPKPPLEEIYRITAPSGICLVGSDPIAQTFQLKLWLRPTKLRPWEKVLKAFFILPFISHIGKTEVEQGILENAFPLSVWKVAFSTFEDATVTIKAFPYGPTQTFESSKKNYFKPHSLAKVVLYFLGGGLQAILKKQGKLKVQTQNPESFLICPDCKINLKKEISIKKTGSQFSCRNCHRTFPIYKNVPIILEEKLKNKVLKTL